MRNSRICPENNAGFSNLMCENAHRAALTLSLYVSPKMDHIKEVLHYCIILYIHFCALSLHSVLCFPNDYHMVKNNIGI